MIKILYIQPIHPAGMDYLAAKPGYSVEIAPNTDRETLKKCIKDADAVITRLTVVDAELMSCANHLKAVCKHGVGIDNIDADYCRAHNIEIITTGDANSSTVAEQAMLAIGALFRRTFWLDAQLRKGDWTSRDRSGAQDLRGKTLGLVGYGRIGSCLAKMAHYGFDMNVLVYDPYAKRDTVEQAGYEWCETLEELLPRADVVSPHVPLTNETRGMIGAGQFAAMKDAAFVINYARGGVVNEKDLYEALVSGKIAGAALDVFEQEPPMADQNPLFQLDNVIVSPHCATFTGDSKMRMSMRLAENLEKLFD